MTVLGILGAGQVGSVLAEAAIGAGWDVVVANSRGPATLADLVRRLGPRARAARAEEAADAVDLVFLAFPYAPGTPLPVRELTGKVVIDNNNHMVRRDGIIPEVDSGRRTVHELRQAQLPGATVVAAFTHVQFHARPVLRVPEDELPALVRLARPAGAPDRRALAVAGDHAEAVEAVARFADDLGFDAVRAGALRDSWRFGPGTPVWRHAIDGRTRDALVHDLAAAKRPR
jgi:8-hydroxy-5-deazaflavin:NADPH oxidoreductase